MPPAAKTIEGLLVDKGLLTADQVDQAQKDQQANGGTFGSAVTRMKFLAEDVFAKGMAELRGTRFVDVTALKPEIMDQLVKLVAPDIAHKYRAIPVGKKFTKFTFAVPDPL